MIKKLIAKYWSIYHNKYNRFCIKNSHLLQKKIFFKLINESINTKFGKKYSFNLIKNINDFQETIPIFNYETLKIYIEKIKSGYSNILCRNQILYLAKTSGTTSGIKYIPITKNILSNHIWGIKSLLLNYMYITKNFSLLDGKMLFLQGNPILNTKDTKIPTGRLSGIIAHYIPKYLQKNQSPSWETNCITDWEKKINKIVEETSTQNITLIGGIPPWINMYFEKLIKKNNKKISHLFPNLQLIITGGVNYTPYQKKIDSLIGKKIHILQTFPASEGFFGYQNDINNDELLLLTNNGIFYEFIPLKNYNNKLKQKTYTIEEIELNIDYALIISTNSGLWRYDIGDIIRFTSKTPYKIIITGRTTHYTSTFGEHVIAHEVESALKETLKKFNCSINEFSIAPQINPKKGLPYHEWLIEFDKLPNNFLAFQCYLDNIMQKKNIYYFDLIQGKILQPLKIFKVKKYGFNEYMKSIGKLGEQNKVPRLSNNRNIADFLYQKK